MDMDGAYVGMDGPELWRPKLRQNAAVPMSICTYFGQRWSQQRHTGNRRDRNYTEGGLDLVHKFRRVEIL